MYGLCCGPLTYPWTSKSTRRWLGASKKNLVVPLGYQTHSEFNQEHWHHGMHWQAYSTVSSWSVLILQTRIIFTIFTLSDIYCKPQLSVTFDRVKGFMRRQRESTPSTSCTLFSFESSLVWTWWQFSTSSHWTKNVYICVETLVMILLSNPS